MKTNRFGLTEAQVMANRAYMKSLPKRDEQKETAFTKIRNYIKQNKEVRFKELKFISSNPNVVLRELVKHGEIEKIDIGQYRWTG